MGLITHDITVITLNAPAPVKSSGGLTAKNAPFSTYRSDQALNFDTMIVETKTLKVSDDDVLFDGILGGKNYATPRETNQTVAETITLGTGSSAQTVTAGTQIGFDYSSWIHDGDGNHYEIAFPRVPGSGTFGDIVGGMYSIIVIPIPQTDSTGNLVDPGPFDPTKAYFFGGMNNYSTTDTSVPYYDPVIDCFATGSLIDTPQGPRPVETLRAGDLVQTRDQGPQPLVWTGHTQVDAAQLDLLPNLRPIRIAAGALAPSLPARDLILSPQHRVLVRSAIVRRMFDESEILVAAKHLIGLPGIEVEKPSQGIGYHHILFDSHQVVRSEGAWTESLYLGPQALKGLGPAGRREVFALFPELADKDFRARGARRLLTGGEGRQLAYRHGKNRKYILSGIM